jgi:FlaA1/EpsC-like NDP-sugar epimerase
VRAGEKLFEELRTTEESMTKTRHPKIYIGKIGAYPEEKVHAALERLEILAVNGWERELRRFLNNLLPEGRLEIAGEPVTPAADRSTPQLAMIVEGAT